MDKVTHILIVALKQALAEPGEHRLYRSGKLAGLFPSRSRHSTAAAAQALRDGLLEVVRTEPRGKFTIDWVRLTPKGVDFVHQQESPLATLRELRELLRLNQQGIPGWLAQIHEQVGALSRKLESLQQRVEEAISRVEATLPRIPQDTLRVVPWAEAVVAYLERRQAGGAPSVCPLSELFHAVQAHHAELTVADFHAGLRRLFDRGVVRLLPWEKVNGLPEPEFALPDGPTTYYHVTR